MTMEETIVKEWLKSLQIECYADSFIDNGYDDLEICKQIDEPDLDAIGVVDTGHRKKILQAVQILRVEGAASVYFTVEEAQAATQDTISRSSDPGPNHEKTKKICPGSSASTPGEVSNLFLGSTTNDIDAYEAGRAELIRFPQLQLQKLIQENVIKDNVNLAVHPYTTKEGERGILEGLASRYADQFNTHFQDVLEHLEYLRLQEWSKILATNKTKFNNHVQVYQTRIEQLEPRTEIWTPRSSSSSSLDHPDEHPIYLPGKYNPSSCLSDAEEDQIYGFTTGSQTASAIPTNGPGYLNPRSHCIYELPPSRIRPCNQNGMKKKLGLGRLLKTLKRDLKRSTDSKNKTYCNSAMTTNARQLCGTHDLSSTPLVVLPGYSSPTSSHCSQSSKSHSSGQSYIVTSASAPGTPGSSGPVRDSGLQQAIERLKEQEIKRRREDQFREHEQILQDIRHGLQQTTSNMSKKGVTASCSLFTNHIGESSYMFDDDNLHNIRESRRPSCASQPAPHYPHHWYDEPPYESDPEDFLIGKENIRDFISNQNRIPREEDVISLKTAGDISLPRDPSKQSSEWPSPRHYYPPHILEAVVAGTISSGPTYNNVMQIHNYLKMDMRPKTLLKTEVLPMYFLENHSGHSDPNQHITTNTLTPESLSYMEQRLGKCQEKSQDVQSISSRLSTMSVDTNRSDSAHVLLSRQINRSSGSDEQQSGTPSDIEEEAERRDSDSLVGRMRVLQRDMQRKISRLKNSSRETLSIDFSSSNRVKEDVGLRDRLEATYSCYQRQNSLPVKLKQVLPLESRGQSIISLDEKEQDSHQIIGHVRALVDYHPSPYESEALKFKKGDMIDLISKSPSGLWKGHLCGRIGYFKFILVEELTNLRPTLRPTRRYGMTHENKNPNLWLHTPGSLRELLIKFNLTHLTQVLVLNGIEELEHFRDICPEDLDQMGIADRETRSKIVAAINFILDAEEYEEATQHWLENSAFIRRTNGRVSLPTGSSSYPFNHPIVAGHINGGRTLGDSCQIYENTSSYLCPPLDDNNLDHSVHSSSSTDTSSGYHSRPPFNITQGSSVLNPSSNNIISPTSLPLQSSSLNPNPSSTLIFSHKSEISPTSTDGHCNANGDATIDSYHAQVAMVQSTPSSPVDGEETLSLESTSC